jgi:hypothetical protein
MSASELWDLARVTVGVEGVGFDVAHDAIYAEPDLPSGWLYENKAHCIPARYNHAVWIDP